MRAGIGYSAKTNPGAAGREAAEKALYLCGGRPDLVLVLIAGNHPGHKVQRGIMEVVGGAVAGFFVPGIIFKKRVRECGVGVCALRGTEIKATSFIQEYGKPPQSRSTGIRAGERVRNAGLKGGTIFTIPMVQGLNRPQLMLQGLYSRLGPAFNYVGGAVLQGNLFTAEEAGDGLLVAAVQGARFSVSRGHGWEPFSQPMVITRARGNRIYEIDGRPAHEILTTRLSHLLGREVEYGEEERVRFPMGIPAADGSFLIRDIIDHHEDGSLSFAYEMPQNTVATIMKGSTESMLGAARSSAAQAAGELPRPEISLLFDCISRVEFMGDDFQRELDSIERGLDEEVPTFGMLSYGEIANSSGIPVFHNKNLALAVGGDLSEPESV